MSNLVLNAGWLGDCFYGIWINLMLLIDNVIYVFINWMYRVFMLVAKVDIFGGGAEIEAITRRVYVIVGIAMLFIFAYNLILLIINPEGKQLGNMGKVVQRSIVSIILVTLLPLIFSYLTTIQNHVLESNVIGQIILGTSSEEDIQTTNKKAGVKAALDIFSAFYHPKGQTYNSCKSNSGAHELCSVYVEAFDAAYQNDDISTFVWDDDLKDGAKEDKMEYNWIISTAAGVFALWMFVSFALDIGVRVGKMAFYELISPIPVMMRILPNDKMFDKWFKGITSTFISLFIRLAVIYFCMYAITLVPNVLSNMWATNGDNVVLLSLANVVVILGILKFAQEAPKLLSDLFGGSGDGLKFGIASKIKDNKLAMGAMGLGAGGALGVAGNVRKMFSKGDDGKVHFKGDNPFRGVGTSMYHGAKGGYKSKDFKELGGSIDNAMYEQAKKEGKYQSRRQKGEAALDQTPIKNSAIAQNIVGGAINIKDSVVKGFKNADEYLSGGSDFFDDRRMKGFKTVKDKISSAVSGLSSKDQLTFLEESIKQLRKDFRDGKTVKINGTDFNNATTSSGAFLKAVGDYEKSEKTRILKEGIEKSNNAKKMELYQESITKALKEALPSFGGEFADTFCKEYDKKFGGGSGQFTNTNEILQDISQKLERDSSGNLNNPALADDMAKKINFVEGQMKQQIGLMEIEQKEKKDSK